MTDEIGAPPPTPTRPLYKNVRLTKLTSTRIIFKLA